MDGLNVLHAGRVGPQPGPPGRSFETADCCEGAREHGTLYCTCWEPVFDVDQAEPEQGPSALRSRCCQDCAFKPDSPEANVDYHPTDRDELMANARAGGERFLCHNGMRRILSWRHPDGREVEAVPGDYAPTMVGWHGAKADGSPAEVCGGYGGYHPTASGVYREDVTGEGTLRPHPGVPEPAAA